MNLKIVKKINEYIYLHVQVSEDNMCRDVAKETLHRENRN